jgi:hypothetical protein
VGSLQGAQCFCSNHLRQGAKIIDGLGAMGGLCNTSQSGNLFLRRLCP